jgi:hypothetical protein
VSSCCSQVSPGSGAVCPLVGHTFVVVPVNLPKEE